MAVAAEIAISIRGERENSATPALRLQKAVQALPVSCAVWYCAVSTFRDHDSYSHGTITIEAQLKDNEYGLSVR